MIGQNPLSQNIDSNTSQENIYEVRVNAQELAACFPESTKFDRTPSSLLNINQQTETSSEPDTAFYPCTNTSTLEPITEEHDNLHKLEEKRIKNKIKDLAEQKLRAETPLIKIEKLEKNCQELHQAILQRDEQIHYMSSSYRNLQRLYNQKTNSYERDKARLERNNRFKNKLIYGFSLASILSLTIAISPLFNKSKQTNAIDQNPIATTISYQTPVNSKKYVYTIQKNDTLEKISEKVYGDKKYFKGIMKLNGLRNSQIKPGTKIIISELAEE